MTAPDSPTRSLTIDRARRARIVRDLVYDVARARPGSWWVGATVVALIALAVAGNVWWAGLGLLIAAASIQLVVWWVAAARGTRHGLGVDDTVSVGFAPDGLLVFTGRRGEFRMARGSAQLVRRSGRNATVFGRSVTLVLPGELLSDQDVAFLEGHGEPADTSAEDAAPVLPLRLRVTDAIQRQIVSAATR